MQEKPLSLTAEMLAQLHKQTIARLQTAILSVPLLKITKGNRREFFTALLQLTAEWMEDEGVDFDTIVGNAKARGLTPKQREQIDLAHKQPDLQETRTKVADEIYESFDFNREVVGADGWESTTPGRIMRRTVYLAHGDGPSDKTTFTVVFAANDSAECVDYY